MSLGNGKQRMRCDRLIMKGCLASLLLDNNNNINYDEDYIDRRLLVVIQKLKQRYALTHKSVVVVKVDVFPMKLQHQIVTNIYCGITE
jgi:hypothetical protein